MPCENSSVASRLRFCRSRSARTSASSVGPSTPQFHDRLSLWPSLLSSPLASLWRSLYDTRSFSVKPSCAVIRFTLRPGPPAAPVEVIARSGQAARQNPRPRLHRLSRTRAPYRESGHSIRPSPAETRRPDSRPDRSPKVPPISFTLESTGSCRQLSRESRRLRRSRTVRGRESSRDRSESRRRSSR